MKMRERILLILLTATVIPVLDKIISVLEEKAKKTDSEIDDIVIIPFRTVLEALKTPGFMDELKK